MKIDNSSIIRIVMGCKCTDGVVFYFGIVFDG